MSDTHAVGSVPAPRAAAPKKGTSKVLVATLVLVVSLAAFAAAMVYGGGLDVVNGLMASLGSGGGGQGSTTTQPAAVPTTRTVTPSAVATDPAIPPLFKRQLFYEQIASQATIGELLGNKFGAFSIGPVTKSARQANIRLTARYRAGGSFGGKMVLKRTDKGWLFFTITRDTNRQVLPSAPAYDEAVVDTIVDQQHEYQETIVGLVNGGYKKMTISGVKAGSGTKTVSYRLSGGTLPAKNASVVAISKTIDGTKYWFLTSVK